MILAALALATPQVAEAERAFAAMAQAKGQWTAFRAFMAPDAFRLTPEPVPAARVLADKADPPRAVAWQPEQTITACDGTLAFSTGPWQFDGGTGRFYTIWQRQPDGAWKWLFDGGIADPVPTAPPHPLIERRTDCGPAPADPAPPAKLGGASRDGTLRWGLIKLPAPGQRVLRIRYLSGGRWITAVNVILQ